MDVNRFLQQLLEELSNLTFVKNLDLNTEVFVVRGRVFMENNFFLQVYFNERTKTTAFALNPTYPGSDNYFPYVSEQMMQPS